MSRLGRRVSQEFLTSLVLLLMWACYDRGSSDKEPFLAHPLFTSRGTYGTHECQVSRVCKYILVKSLQLYFSCGGIVAQ